MSRLFLNNFKTNNKIINQGECIYRMAIQNKICKDCDKYTVCSWAKTIDKFDEEMVKNPINTIIEIKECPEFKDVK